MKNLSDITEVRSVKLHASGLADYETCPRKLLFRYRAGLVPKGLISPSLLRGDMLHGYVAAAVVGDKSPAETINRRAAAELEKAKGLLGPSGYLSGGQTLDEVAARVEKDRLVALAMSKAYCRFFGVVHGKIGSLRVYKTEVRVDSDHDAGTLDAIAKGPGGWWIIDHKTHGRDLAGYAATLPLAPQTIMYPGLLKAAGFTGKVLGIVYNIIKTPTIHCCKTDDWDVNKYAQRVERWYEDQPESLLRTRITVGPEQAKLHAVRIDRGRKACTSLPVVADFPATGGAACSQYNSTCPFLPLCTSDTVTWRDTIERLYDKDWRDDENESSTDD